MLEETHMQKVSLILWVVVLLVVPGILFAADVHIGKEYFLKGGQRVMHDLYVFGPAATLAGSIDGDAIALSGTVWSESSIGADALFIGEEIHALGVIGDDARLAGGNIQIGGQVKDDAVLLGGRVALLQGADILGNLYLISGEAELHGTVRGNAKILSRQARIFGNVGGDLEIWGEPVIEPGAAIGKDLIYHASREVQIPSTVTIGGRVIFDERKGGTGSLFSGLNGLLSGVFSLELLMALALGFFVFLLARSRTEEVLLDATAYFWPRLLRGLFIMFLLPLFVMALAMTIVGIPTALLLLMLFLAGCVLSSAFSGMLLGVWIERVFFKRSAFPLGYRPVLLGILFLVAISMVPYVGFFLYVALLLASLGSVGTLFFRSLRRPL